MEDFKDVMLSEPPQRYAAPVSSQHTAGTTAVGQGQSAFSLESYKGILLCDRPADTRANRAAQQQPPFLPAGNAELDRGNGSLGLQPSIEQRAKISLNRGQPPNGRRVAHAPVALTRHRRWLASFASEVKKMRLGKEEALNQTKARMAAIREREASKRRLGGGEQDAGAPSSSAVDSAVPPPASKSAATTTHKKLLSKPKPKWAMTEEEAEDAEFAEARELIDFAAELDFDTFIKDYEVQEALGIMRERVKEIAAEKGIDLEAARREEHQHRTAADESNDAAGETASTASKLRAYKGALRQLKQSGIDNTNPQQMGRTDDMAAASANEHRPAWNDSTATSAFRSALQADALKLAERILQKSEALRKIHSKMSMTRLLEDVAMELQLPPASRAVPMAPEPSVPMPLTSAIAADATGASAAATSQPSKRILTELRQSKTHVQNLPYMYRCPSI